MGFESEIKEFSNQINSKLEHIDTEETTKIALITPFLRLLGYDTTNPGEVKAEYTADIGAKQGEKVDFAILKNNKPQIFIECKSAHNTLDASNISQLYRYFSITDIKIGILTNGIEYMFFTNGEDNRMEDKPFLDINLLNLTKKDIKELENFIKTNFNVEEVITRADDLKYKILIKKCLLKELDNPSDEFVRVIGKQVYDGVLYPALKDKFRKIIINVNNELINETVEKRLTDAVTKNDELEEPEINTKEPAIITTDKEIEAYYIVKSILSEICAEDRVFMKDRKDYCNIVLDNNVRRQLVTLKFNNESNLRIRLYDNFTKNDRGKKISPLINIDSVHDLYKYKDNIIDAFNKYDKM